MEACRRSAVETLSRVYAPPGATHGVTRPAHNRSRQQTNRNTSRGSSGSSGSSVENVFGV